MHLSKPPGPAGRPAAPWHALTSEAVLERVTSHAEGLSEQEGRQRLARHGPNVLERESQSGPLRVLFRQINTPLIWVLLGAALLAVALGKVTDGLVVLAVVVLN